MKNGVPKSRGPTYVLGVAGAAIRPPFHPPALRMWSAHHKGNAGSARLSDSSAPTALRPRVTTIRSVEDVSVGVVAPVPLQLSRRPAIFATAPTSARESVRPEVVRGFSWRSWVLPVFSTTPLAASGFLLFGVGPFAGWLPFAVLFGIWLPALVLLCCERSGTAIRRGGPDALAIDIHSLAPMFREDGVRISAPSAGLTKEDVPTPDLAAACCSPGQSVPADRSPRMRPRQATVR